MNLDREGTMRQLIAGVALTIGIFVGCLLAYIAMWGRRGL